MFLESVLPLQPREKEDYSPFLTTSFRNSKACQGRNNIFTHSVIKCLAHTNVVYPAEGGEKKTAFLLKQ